MRALVKGHGPQDVLDLFLDERSQARRFHAGSLGHGVDAEHCLADFLCRVRRHDSAGIAKNYWPEIAKGARSNLAEMKGPEGGYLVPPELSTNLLRDLSTGSLFRRHGAYVHPMASETESLPVVDVSAATTGVSPYFGAMQFFWLADNTTFAMTAPKFREVALKANSQGGYLYVSNPMLQDARGIDAWLYGLVANGLAWYQDLAFFQGSGVGQPRGIVSKSGGAYFQNRGTGGTISLADAQAMVDNLLPSAWDVGAVWFCHPSTLTKLTNFTGWIPNGPLLLLGLPVIPTGKCSTLGTVGDLILAMPSCYVIGDRCQYEIAYSQHEPTAMLANKSAFRAYARIDGQTLTAAPIVLSDGATQVSPFVVLQ